jgi:peptidoglycan hydrolase-like protein with peptidoglycan-binding domain
MHSRRVLTAPEPFPNATALATGKVAQSGSRPFQRRCVWTTPQRREASAPGLRGSASGTGSTSGRPEQPFSEFDEPVLSEGSTGLPVRRAQSRLTAAGFDTGGGDGAFGPQTESAVRALQQATGLTVDGIVGPQTWQQIDALGD